MGGRPAAMEAISPAPTSSAPSLRTTSPARAVVAGVPTLSSSPPAGGLPESLSPVSPPPRAPAPASPPAPAAAPPPCTLPPPTPVVPSPGPSAIRATCCRAPNARRRRSYVPVVWSMSTWPSGTQALHSQRGQAPSAGIVAPSCLEAQALQTLATWRSCTGDGQEAHHV